MASQLHVSIAVYAGDPVDFMKFRHTLLWFRFSDPTPSFIYHVIGVNPSYEREMREHDPSKSTHKPTIIPVTYLRKPAGKDAIVDLMGKVPIDQKDREYNCHTWVDFALRALRDEGYISTEDYEGATDKMVAAIAEAKDE